MPSPYGIPAIFSLDIGRDRLTSIPRQLLPIVPESLVQFIADSGSPIEPHFTQGPPRILATLLSLPTEITALIACQLSANDFFHFRQICRSANSRTLSLFAKQYFPRRYVMLERRSLENLVRISRHRVLGPSVYTLDICIDHFTDPFDLEVLLRDDESRDEDYLYRRMERLC